MRGVTCGLEEAHWGFRVPSCSSRYVQLCKHRDSAWWGKSRFAVGSAQNTEFILVSFINDGIIFHTNHCQPTFVDVRSEVLF